MSDGAPAWDQLRANRWMVVDHAALQFGVYPTTTGAVMLLFQHAGTANPQMVALNPDDIPLLCKQLVCAQGIAERERQACIEAESAQMAFDLMNKMKEVAR